MSAANWGLPLSASHGLGARGANSQSSRSAGRAGKIAVKAALGPILTPTSALTHCPPTDLVQQSHAPNDVPVLSERCLHRRNPGPLQKEAARESALIARAAIRGYPYLLRRVATGGMREFQITARRGAKPFRKLRDQCCLRHRLGLLWVGDHTSLVGVRSLAFSNHASGTTRQAKAVPTGAAASTNVRPSHRKAWQPDG